jgi:hypothetical protein
MIACARAKPSGTCSDLRCLLALVVGYGCSAMFAGRCPKSDVRKAFRRDGETRPHIATETGLHYVKCDSAK